MANVAILMSTFNGSKFICEQIESIEKQSFTAWSLYIRDDGSCDETVCLIRKLAQKNSRIIIVDSNENLGVSGSFLHLLSIVKADYYFFCDQDDVWDRNKLDVMLKKMAAKESIYKGVPILGVSDAIVVDENLNVVHESFWKFNMLFPELFTTTNYVEYINVSPGCTMVLNNSLKEVYMNNILEFDFIYDWYLMILASKFGLLFYVEEGLVYYRQHQSNVIGAEKVSLYHLFFDRIKNLKHIRKKHQKHYEFLKKSNNLNLFNFYFNKMKFNFIRFQYGRSRKS